MYGIFTIHENPQIYIRQMYIGKYGCFRKWWYPQIIHFNRVFHYKPSILGYPYFWKHPYTIQWSIWDTSHLLPVEVVTLTGNPLKALRQALVAKGWSAVAQHLRKQRLEVQGLSIKIEGLEILGGGMMVDVFNKKVGKPSPQWPADGVNSGCIVSIVLWYGILVGAPQNWDVYSESSF